MHRTSSKNGLWRGITLAASKLEERRAIGRPRLRWLEVVEKDLREMKFNHLTPNGHYMGRTAQLTSRCCILYIYSTNKRTEYFKHAA